MLRKLLVLAAPLLVAACGVEVDRTGDPSMDEPADERGTESTLGTLAAGTELVTTGALNLRKGPAKTTSVLAVMPKGAKVIALGDPPTGAYQHVRFGAVIGWAHGDWLAPVAVDAGAPTPAPSSEAGAATPPPPKDPPPASAVYHPTAGTTWQWQLVGTIDTSVDVAMYDIDLFNTDQATIDTLHAKGRKVICYFSAGSREDWRPDAGAFTSADYGKGLSGWPGENWLDTRRANVRTIMKKRLDLAVAKRCDGVEPDNVDGHQNDTGLGLTKANLIDYNKFLVAEAHGRNLAIGLKNALDLVSTLVGSYDFALNESCLAFSECDQLRPFIDAGKAVFHVEYVASESAGAAKKAAVCGKPSIAGFSTLIKKENDSVALDAWRLACK